MHWTIVVCMRELLRLRLEYLRKNDHALVPSGSYSLERTSVKSGIWRQDLWRPNLWRQDIQFDLLSLFPSWYLRFDLF